MSRVLAIISVCAAGQGSGIGARIAFCREKSKAFSFLHAGDELLRIDGVDVSRLPTVEVLQLALQSSADIKYSCS
jgi:hypothetical protein